MLYIFYGLYKVAHHTETNARVSYGFIRFAVQHTLTLTLHLKHLPDAPSLSDSQKPFAYKTVVINRWQTCNLEHYLLGQNYSCRYTRHCYLGQTNQCTIKLNGNKQDVQHKIIFYSCLRRAICLHLNIRCSIETSQDGKIIHF